MKKEEHNKTLNTTRVLAPNVEDKDGGNENQAQNQNDNRVTTKVKKILLNSFKYYTLRPGVSSEYIFIIPAALPERLVLG